MARGPTRRCVAYVRDAGDQLERLYILTRADVTTRNRRKRPTGSGLAYDDLEERIAAIAEAEGIAAVRPGSRR